MVDCVIDEQGVESMSQINSDIDEESVDDNWRKAGYIFHGAERLTIRSFSCIGTVLRGLISLSIPDQQNMSSLEVRLVLVSNSPC